MARTKQPPKPHCRWTVDEHDGSWNGDCGAKWVFNEGGPVENKMRFCPQCGALLTADPLR